MGSSGGSVHSNMSPGTGHSPCAGLQAADRRSARARTRAPGLAPARRRARCQSRSEEHTSELQSQSNLVCRLLLEKKKKKHLVTTSRITTRVKPLHDYTQ